MTNYRVATEDIDYYVVLYERRDGSEVEVKAHGPMSERRAEKVDDGLNINLNHEQFFTRIERR